MNKIPIKAKDKADRGEGLPGDFVAKDTAGPGLPVTVFGGKAGHYHTHPACPGRKTGCAPRATTIKRRKNASRAKSAACLGCARPPSALGNIPPAFSGRPS